MQEIKEMFRKRIHLKECLLQQRQAQREQYRKEKEEQSKLKEWETYMNVTKVKRQQQQYSNEMQVKLQKQQARVDQFLREKELIIQRGHYNIIVEQMRKQLQNLQIKIDNIQEFLRQLMKETFKEMEIRNKYQEKLLKKIDQDFKNELINEQDQSINEVELQQRYISLFNLMSNYQKMFQQSGRHIIEIMYKRQKTIINSQKAPICSECNKLLFDDDLYLKSLIQNDYLLCEKCDQIDSHNSQRFPMVLIIKQFDITREIAQNMNDLKAKLLELQKITECRQCKDNLQDQDFVTSIDQLLENHALIRCQKCSLQLNTLQQEYIDKIFIKFSNFNQLRDFCE